METVALKIVDLVKHFAQHKVLDGINFTINAGEIFGLIGLNGMGKTTIIKSLLNLIDINAGNISLFGINALEFIAREKVCYLPEKFQPSSHLKGKEFLQIFLGSRFNLDEAKDYAQRLALEPEALQQKISKYSKGMTQKLGLIYAFMSSAELIILDEPMSGLDPKARISLKTELKHAKNIGRTVFFSSHILTDIEEICDRLAVLHNGKIVFSGTPTYFKQKHQQNNIEKAFLQEIGLLD